MNAKGAWSWVGLGVLGAGALLLARSGGGGAHAGPGGRGGPEAPAAPVWTPESALRLFELADPELEVELVVAEPDVTAPVSLRFDEDGRLWVVEMPTYMVDVRATGEKAPSNRISVFEDRDGDGRFETRRTFLEGLRLPRGVMPCFQKGGRLAALVIEPPEVSFAEDTDGDGVADKRTVLLKGIAGLENPEHAPNGLMMGIDGWIEFSQHNTAFRFDGEKVETRSNPGHGQWGITMDDLGRVYYTPNSEALRVDAVPKRFAARSRSGGLAGVNELSSPDQTVWPSHATPGVNRGYQPGVLRADGTLQSHTAACSPTIDRSGFMGAGYLGNAYVCEPAANMVRRLVLKDDNGIPRARNAYERTEWLRTADERFRPVATCMGPDGALYIADMYRGVIQHKTYLTPYLKDQIASRNLETAVAMGRIWRVKPKRTLRPVPHLSSATDAELAVLLKKAPDGWTRDTAQRLLIERKPEGLRALFGVRVRGGNQDPGQNRTPSDQLADQLVDPSPAELWTLRAVGQLRASDLSAAVMNEDPALAESVAMLCGEFPGWDAVAASMLGSRHRRVRWAAALSLGPGPKSPSGGPDRHAEDLLRAALAEDDRVMRGCVVNALADAELEALAVLASGKSQGKVAGMLAADLADSCIRGPSAARRGALLAWAAGEAPEPLRRAVVDRIAGIIGVGRPSGAKKTAVAVDREPSSWMAMAEGRGPLSGKAREITVWLDWPGRPEVDRGTKPQPLTAEQQASFDRGKVVFATTCAACHGPEGKGVPGQTPPLAGSPRATGPVPRVARIVLHGMDGSFERDGSVYNGQMPAAVALSDRQIGDVLTFVRRSWGNSAGPIPGSQVLSIRVKSAGRSRPWTVGEIDSFPEEEP